MRLLLGVEVQTLYLIALIFFKNFQIINKIFIR
jgi:hypothetical protein